MPAPPAAENAPLAVLYSSRSWLADTVFETDGDVLPSRKAVKFTTRSLVVGPVRVKVKTRFAVPSSVTWPGLAASDTVAKAGLVAGAVGSSLRRVVPTAELVPTR